MAVEVTVLGEEQLRRLAAKLREADRDFDRELVNGIRRAVSPIGRAIKAGIPSYMPSGYAPILAASARVSVSVRRTRLPGVRVVVKAMGNPRERDVASLDVGALRHPLFGNRHHWYLQKVRAGFATDEFNRQRGPAVEQMRRVVEATKLKIERF